VKPLISFFKKNPKEPDSLEKTASKWVSNNFKISCVKLGLIIFVVGGTIATKNIHVTKSDGIAKIDVKGVIKSGQPTGDGSVLAQKFIEQTRDKSVKAIYIAANSPGGSPVQAEIFYNAINQYTKLPLSEKDKSFIGQDFSEYDPFLDSEKKEEENEDKKSDSRKPVIAVIQESCTSACLYMIASADVIVAHKSSLVGSIGVRVDTWEFSDLIKELKIKRISLTTGKNKAILDPYVKADPKEEKLIRKHMLNPMFEAFKDALLTARGDKLVIDDSLFSGLMWAGVEAKEKGLIDQVATTYQVIEAMKQNYDASIKETNPKKFTLNSLLDASSVIDYVTEAISNTNILK